MITRGQRRCLAASLAAVAAVGIAACSSNGTPSASSTAAPQNIEIVVDTGPGGGSDVWAREIVKLLLQAHLISSSWPVRNETAGGGLGAMAYLKSKKGANNEIAFFTTKWVIGGLTTKNAPARLSDLTPIASLLNEPVIVAAGSQTPYHTMTQFVAAAKQHPDQLVSTGGEPDSVEHLTELAIQQETGTSWKYLPYAGSGPRIAALLHGDAQIMVGAPDDFAEQVKAGQLRIITTVTPTRLSLFPTVPTLAQQGLQGSLPADLQVRGVAGPPDMPAGAIAYFERLFSKLVKLPAWRAYLASVNDTTQFSTGSQLRTLLSSFTTSMTHLLSTLPNGIK